MWSITNSIGRMLGIKNPQVVPPFTLHAQGFHAFTPSMAGLAMHTHDRKFTNPNFVNPGNPSVLSRRSVIQACQPQSCTPGVINAQPPAVALQIGAENSSTDSNKAATEEIGARSSNEMTTNQQKTSEDGPSAVRAVQKRGNGRKRSRRNRRARRKRRDSRKTPGKHCKNADKEAKHSKHVEQEQVMKEAMEIEDETVGVSFLEVDVAPVEESHPDHCPLLFDYIQAATPEDMKLSNEERSKVEYYNRRNLIQNYEEDSHKRAGRPQHFVDHPRNDLKIQHEARGNLTSEPDINRRNLYDSLSDLSEDESDDDDGICMDTEFYDRPLDIKEQVYAQSAIDVDCPSNHCDDVRTDEEEDDNDHENQLIRPADQAFYDNLEYCSEEETDDDEHNCVDAVICEAPLNVIEHFQGKDDEVDVVVFTSCLKRPVRSRQISVADSEDSFIVFNSGTDEECVFSDEESDYGDEEESEVEDVETDYDESDSGCKSNSSVIPAKKVRFADDNVLCDVHPMIKWAYAYQSARRGPWEEYARDRERFKRRIAETGRVLNAVFQPAHRKHVFDERFANMEVLTDT